MNTGNGLKIRNNGDVGMGNMSSTNRSDEMRL